jgi:hypothetical protein
MSIPYSVQAQSMVISVSAEEARGPSRLVRGRGEGRDQPANFRLASRDVIDEARVRMARRGFLWD